MDVRRLLKKLQQEIKKPENKAKRDFLILEGIMILVYIGMMFLQYHGETTRRSGYVGRWCVILVSILGWWNYHLQVHKK